MRQNALMNRLLTIISHDARAPLNSLQSFLSLLADNQIKQSELPQVAASLHTQIDHLSHFLENLLRWSKNNADEIKPRFEILALKPLVEEVVELHRLVARSKQIFMYINMAEDIRVFADEEMIKLVLRNLIANALKFCYTDDSIHIQATEHHGFVTIAVHDTGRGIGKQDLAGLFTSTQPSARGTKNEIGLGLGLSLCKEFVEKMGGKITVESTEGRGTRFEFSVHAPTSAGQSLQQFIDGHEKTRV
jgi:two-component system sensor histidine kinase/response regulator